MANTTRNRWDGAGNPVGIWAIFTRKYGSILALNVVAIILVSSLSFGFAQGITSLDVPGHMNGISPIARFGNDPSPMYGSPSFASLYPNPYEIYQREPAPMGLADYGLGINGTPYAYSTTSFLGIARIGNISVTNNSLGQYIDSVSIQLNVNLEFSSDGNFYVYWIQDVANLNASSHYISFVDNIWNFSSKNANVYSSAVIGNGTIELSKSTYFYYNLASSGLPGNDVSLSEPFTVMLMVNTSVDSKGVPVVDFKYNDGKDWVTYDHVNFVVAKQLEGTPEFVVNGFQYEPTGYTFYDAELVLGGPGGGSDTNIERSDIQMMLDYFNGKNYQMVTNAYNFGSNTAEGISNVTVSGAYYSENGTIFSNVVQGIGTLGSLYFGNQVSILNVTSPISSGILYVNDTPYYFVKGGANVTIAPSGSDGMYGYNVSIYTLNGSGVWSQYLQLFAGEYLSIDVNTYPLEFIEKSFPNGTLWYLNLSNGQSFRSTTDEIKINLANGTYSYTANPLNKNFSSSKGTFKMSGLPLVISIMFSPVQFRTYTVTFDEFGLKSGISWSVTLGGTTISSTKVTITFTVLNGTYTYSIGNISAYLVSPTSGSVVVNGANVSIPISFSELYTVVLSENGLPPGTLWYVNLTNGESYSSYDSVVSFTEINGTYNYTTESTNPTYQASWGTFIVHGHSVSKSIYFSPVTYNITFLETGLPDGHRWFINITGIQNLSSDTPVISVRLSNGTYHFTVSSSNKAYSPVNNYGILTVNGSSINRSIEFISITYSVAFAKSGLPSGIGWTVSLNGTMVSKSGTIIFIVSNGSYNFSVSGISGYVASEYNGNILVDGSAIVYHITWSVRTYQLTMEVSGIPSNEKWSVTLTGVSFNGENVSIVQNSSYDVMQINLPNGTYFYRISPPLGFIAAKGTGNFNVSGSEVSETIMVHQGFNYSILVLLIVIAVIALSIVVVTLHYRRRSILVRERTK